MSSSAERIQARPARWPWAVLAAFLAVAAVGLALVVANDEGLAEQIPYVVAFAMFGVVGAVIVSRDRRNTIGLIFLYASFVTAFSFLGGEILTRVVTEGETGGWLVPFAFLSTFGWLFGILPTIFLLPLLFPDGRLPSARWRPLVWFIAGFLVFIGVDLTLGQRTLTGSNEAVGIANPLFVEAVGRLPKLDSLIAIFFPGIFGASLVSLVLRFRRSVGVERQQIKWVVFGFGLALLGILSTSFSGDEETLVTAAIGAGSFLLIPVSIGIAVLRFHLYDLDVVVRKTLIYGAFAVFATLIYLALVVGAGIWLGRDNSFLTMIAAVVVAVTFQPVRARLTRFANRVVYGKRATPYEVLSEFSERVGGAYADEDVLPRMVRVLGEGIGAERADVWLAVDRELRDVAAWPGGAAARPAIPLPNGSVPAIDGMDRVYPVEQAGELLGALAIRKPTSDPVSPADEKLISDLASQAGLVLRNVRLTEALKVRLDDLQAAQKRVITAQDEGRRRLERNIHDGAQQQLVALAVKLRLARGFVSSDPAKAESMLDAAQAETNEALEDLRDLARGIYPPLLADKGLVAALQAQARKVSVPITVDTGAGVDRYPQDVEAAAYFCCLEAFQNVAKYANASRIDVRIGSTNGVLSLQVTDDGMGFDAESAVTGSGLQGMEDRLAAIGGSLVVRSAPGAGTAITCRIPLGVAQEASA